MPSKMRVKKEGRSGTIVNNRKMFKQGRSENKSLHFWVKNFDRYSSMWMFYEM